MSQGTWRAKYIHSFMHFHPKLLSLDETLIATWKISRSIFYNQSQTHNIIRENHPAVCYVNPAHLDEKI